MSQWGVDRRPPSVGRIDLAADLPAHRSRRRGGGGRDVGPGDVGVGRRLRRGDDERAPRGVRRLHAQPPAGGRVAPRVHARRLGGPVPLAAALATTGARGRGGGLAGGALIRAGWVSGWRPDRSSTTSRSWGSPRRTSPTGSPTAWRSWPAPSGVGEPGRWPPIRPWRGARAHPVPMASAAMSMAAVRRAAGHGVGIVFDSLSAPERVRRVGRRLPRRRRGPGVHPHPSGLGGHAPHGRDGTGRSTSTAATPTPAPRPTGRPTSSWPGPTPRRWPTPSLDVMARAGVDACNLRVHAPGIAPGTGPGSDRRPGRRGGAPADPISAPVRPGSATVDRRCRRPCRRRRRARRSGSPGRAPAHSA